MIVKINGKIKPYYVQTLAMIFFPGVRFPEDEEENEETLHAYVEEEEKNGTLKVSVTIACGGRKAKAFAEGLLTDGTASRDSIDSECVIQKGEIFGDVERKRKKLVGDAFLKAAGEFTGYTPPWGSLTGVRPAKVATELLSSGITRTDAVKTITEEYHAERTKASLAVDVALSEASIITDEKRKECSVYIAIPFCPTRCAYCSFVSYTSPGLLKLIPDYLNTLALDIENIFSVIREFGMRVSTVYIGGGTPTVLNEEQLDFLLSNIRKNVSDFEEFTLEAGRPDTINRKKLKIAAEYGVTRLSVNTQTLNDEILKKIGRAHSSEMFFEAYGIARDSGIRDINVDLIAGLPYDTTESFIDTIDRIIALHPENITVHTFSVKRASEFKKEGDKFDRSSIVAAESVEYSQKALSEAGYLPYYMYRQKNTVGNLENVGYSLPGHEGLYNVFMMEEVHSIFSAGASSVTKFVSLPDENGNVKIDRIFHPKYPYEYLSDYTRENALEKRETLKKSFADFLAKR